MQWPAPMESRNYGGMREVRHIKPHIVRPKRKSSPYFDEAIVKSRCNNEGRVRRELREFHRVCQLLPPCRPRYVVQKPECQIRVSHKKLLVGTPRYRPDRFFVILVAEGRGQRPLSISKPLAPFGILSNSTAQLQYPWAQPQTFSVSSRIPYGW